MDEKEEQGVQLSSKMLMHPYALLKDGAASVEISVGGPQNP